VTLQDAILLGLKASIVLTVFAVGLSRDIREATFMFRNPGVLARSLVAMDLVMPVFAAAVIGVTTLPAPVKIALAALSVSPVPPLLPKNSTKVGGSHEFAVGLMVAASIVALVFVPLAVGILGDIHGVDAHVSFLTVAALMAITILGPLAVGIAVRNNWPEFAERLVKPLGRIAAILLVLCALPVIFGMWPLMMSLVGNGTLAAFACFVLVGLAVGHSVGGPDPDERAVLAIATSSRHPGVAIAIASASFPHQKLVTAAVILYLLVTAVISLPYALWRKRRAVAPSHAPIPTSEAARR
jgi:BASS family bile acid:Na+ symporter